MSNIPLNEQSNPCCPQCSKPMAPERKDLDNNSYSPFCSRLCKMVDLDKWFSADYAISQSVEELTEDQINEILNDEIDNVQTGNDIHSTG